MNRGMFVTGTGTDVGKTIVTAGLLRMLRMSGLDAVSMKPVQTGAVLRDGRLESPDLRVHWEAARYTPDSIDLELMAPYLFEPACSPHLAARLAGGSIKLDHVVTCAERLLASHQALLVEGAGGVLVPLDDTRTNLDLMVALGMPVLVVAHRGLGTINHTLLSLRALRGAGLRVLGVVFNEIRDVARDYIAQDNVNAVAAFGDVAVLGNIDHLGCETLDWDRFATGMTGLPAIRETLVDVE